MGEKILSSPEDNTRVCNNNKRTVNTNLIALDIKIKSGNPGISSLPETYDLLWPIPFKHSDTSILCTCEI